MGDRSPRAMRGRSAHFGSPTILVGGRDPFATGAE